MARLVRSKQLSPLELVDAHLARIEKLNPVLNAFVYVDAEGAREQARNVEKRLATGDSALPLAGVPLSIKSCISVAGLPCECGSKLRQGHRPLRDATLVARLRAAGAAILGVTNVPELLVAYETDNLLYGRTNNPWDLSRTPGGSSGGEAASIAACCSAAGVGSDGGGSIRVPAHFSGICGLKPTPGRVPITGHEPPSLGPSSIVGVVGPMARRVADLRLLFEATAGYDPYDAASAPVNLRAPDAACVTQVRIGYFEDDGTAPVTEETREALRRAAAALREQGFTVEPFRPAGLDNAIKAWWTLFGEAGALLVESAATGRQDELHPITREILQAVPYARAGGFEKLLNAWVDRDLMRERLLRQMERCPVLLCPVASIPAFRHREREWTVAGQTLTYPDAFRFCQAFNLLGNPGLVVPAGRSAEGLPIGVQLVGRPWEDEMLLAIAGRLEEALGAWQAPPERAR